MLRILLLVFIMFNVTSCLEEDEAITVSKVKKSNIDDDNSLGEDSGGESSNPATLIFEEDFEYNLSDLSTNWTISNKHSSITHEISQNNGSNAWAANYGSSHWGTSIVSKQTFNLPVTIEWDQHQVSSSAPSTTASEGLCIYEGAEVRNSYYHYVVGATNLGCLWFYRNSIDPTPIFYGVGVLYNSSHPDVDNFDSSANTHLGIHLASVYLDYRVTITMRQDLTFDVTIQFKDGPGGSEIHYDGVIPSESVPTNFYLDFNNGDYSSGKTFYDNIKVWDGEVSPTPIN